MTERSELLRKLVAEARQTCACDKCLDLRPDRSKYGEVIPRSCVANTVLVTLIQSEAALERQEFMEAATAIMQRGARL